MPSGQSIAHVSATSTPLAGGATFNSDGVDTDAVAGSYSKFRALAYSDVAGTLNVQQSRDGVTWRTTKSAAIPAGATAVIVESLISRRYMRAQVVNGAGAEATLELDEALVAI